MADDTRYYLKINAIAGSVTTKPYQGWIEIGSYSFDDGHFIGRNSGSSKTARDSDMWFFNFTTLDEKASARLRIADARGEVLTGFGAGRRPIRWARNRPH